MMVVRRSAEVPRKLHFEVRASITNCKLKVLHHREAQLPSYCSSIRDIINNVMGLIHVVHVGLHRKACTLDSGF
jgi:hypothetical protein